MIRDALRFALPVFLIFAVACASPETEAPEAGGPEAVQAETPQHVSTIPEAGAVKVFPKAEGITYYDGGPIVRDDAWGRTRIFDFNGETDDPPVTGLVIGFRESEDGRFEMHTHINGALKASNFGYRREDRTLWYDRRLSFIEGAIATELILEDDDAAEETSVNHKEFDFRTGELIEEKRYKLPYAPPPEPEIEEIDEDDEDVITFGPDGVKVGGDKVQPVEGAETEDSESQSAP